MFHVPTKASKENATPRRAQRPVRPLANGAGSAQQARLTVAPGNDEPEREATRSADRVVRAAASDAAASSEASSGSQVQRLPAANTASDAATAPPQVNNVLRGSGQALDGATRNFMESRFGWDLGRVRVHADSTSAMAARSLGATAYTVGRDIVFDTGQYTPGTASGQRLLAHELTHVLQQQSGGHRVQRQKKPEFDAGKVANDVEKQAVEANDEGGALQKLAALEMEQLLQVVNRLYDDWRAKPGPDPMITMANFGDTYRGLGGDVSGWALLSIDLFLTPPSARTSNVTKDLDVKRLRAAFDSARVHKQRNPKGKDKGTNPTHAGARDLSRLGQPARPGDWGEDKWGNTWVMQLGSKDNPDALAIRTYWRSPVAKDKRSSQWLGNNVGNFGYNPAISKRAIGSFQWGSDFRAIYFKEADSTKDLRDNMRKYKTVGDYVDKGHLGPKDDRATYYSNMGKEVKFSPGDATADWVNNEDKWAELVKGFKRAEGWVEGTEVTAEKIREWSASATPGSKDAEPIAYYAALLGVPITTPAAQSAAPNPP